MNTDLIVKPPQSRVLKSARVTLQPGEEVGEHITENREEIVVVLKGKATLQKEGRLLIMESGTAHFIAEGIKHNVRNESREPLEYAYIVAKW